MISTNDILTQWQTFKERVNEYYALIYGAKDADATLDGLTSTSKTAEYNLWMWIGAGVAMIMDSLWEDREKAIQEKIDSFIPMPDRWLHRECLKFQYGDALLWDEEIGKYYYATIDETKQIIKRCAVPRNGGTTFVKVAKLSGDTPVALSAPELTAFITYVNQIQWAGSRIATPTSFNSDKLNAPMTVYYDGTIPLDDVKAIVEPAFVDYLANLPFNGEYSINKHGDWIEEYDSRVIKEVIMGVVEAKTDAGSYADVNRVYTPVAGYIEKDSAIDFDDMITYVAA